MPAVVGHGALTARSRFYCDARLILRIRSTLWDVKSRRAIAASALVALAACGGGSSSPPHSSASPSTSSAALPSYILKKIDVGKQPCAVEGGFGSIWVSLYGEDTELRIDPASGKVLARIKTGIAPCGVAVGGGAVWVEDYGGYDVTRIDPATNAATRIKVGKAPYDVTFAAGAAWVTNYGDDTVSRIDAATRKVRTVKVDPSPVGIAPAGGAVWVTSQIDDTIDRIDPSTLAVTRTKVGASGSWTSWGDGLLWISVGGAMKQINVSGRGAGRVVTTARAPGAAMFNDGDIDGGRVYVPDNTGELRAYDAHTGARIGAWPTGLSNPFVLAGYLGKLWVVDFTGTALEEIDPSRLR